MTVASPKLELDFQDVSRRLRALGLPEVDVVVGIATGGVVPASLVAYHLGAPLKIIHLNFRDPDNKPRREAPTLLEPFDGPAPGSRVLLVDDVSVSGATMAVARQHLAGCEVTTLAFKGKADLVVLPEVASCVVWPWALSPAS
ncbi:MAG TPA: phosphoribosyltransferase [Trueperaceae bacterium]|nr:phosphoribosyltransferase [Trueperaceae bacterium]